MGPQKYFYIRHSNKNNNYNSNNILTRIVKHQMKFHREALDSTFFGDIRNSTGHSPDKPALLDLSLSRELD